MAMKRKFDDAGESAAKGAKQLKLAIPFPNASSDLDSDVAMSDAEPLYDHQHVRASSNASYASSDTSEDSPCYPSFDIYPNAFFNANGTVDADSDSFATYSGTVPVPAGLLQPPTGFVHHGTGCSQIPKLRVACAPGIHGERTMWSLCEQCGAIQMVESSS